MAKQRYINTRFWSDNFVSELNPLDRYLFLYFLTNEHTNIAGIYEVPLKTISFETGIELDMLKKMFKRLDGKVYYLDGWVYIKNFAKHQSVNDSIVKGVESAKKSIPEEILNKINKIEQGVYRVSPESPQSPTYLNSNSNLNSNLKAETNSAEIPLILKAFEEINPAVRSMYGNKTQRKACEWLLKEFGLELLISMIASLPKINAMKYAPTTTTPYELQNNYAKIKAFAEKERSSIKSKGRGFA